jgi:hypothetical protein
MQNPPSLEQADSARAILGHAVGTWGGWIFEQHPFIAELCRTALRRRRPLTSCIMDNALTPAIRGNQSRMKPTLAKAQVAQ